jgi:hypothetical protein
MSDLLRWLQRFVRWLLGMPALVAVVECSCGMVVQVPEFERVRCNRCAAWLWIEVDRRAVDVFAEVPGTYPWREHKPEVMKLGWLVNKKAR